MFILGGNQSDAVNAIRVDEGKVVGYRWPGTMADFQPNGSSRIA